MGVFSESPRGLTLYTSPAPAPFPLRRALVCYVSFSFLQVRQWQDLFYNSRYSGTEMVNPDFAQLARALGGKGLEVSKEADVERVVKEFLFADPDVPTLLNAVCEADEHVYPMVPAGHGLDEMVMGRKATGGADKEGPACR
jgi:acetolactate synthase-1/2/3 large subunit